MQVFKTYFKIILANLPQMLIYLIVFQTLGVLFTFTSKPVDRLAFTETAVSIGVINNDGNQVLTQSFLEFLNEEFIVVPLETTEKIKQDALFFREVTGIVTIPTGFSESFSNNEQPKVPVVTLPNDVQSFYIEEKINQFLTTLNRYVIYLPEDNLESQIKNTKEDLNKKIQIEMADFSISSSSQNLGSFYNYGAYALLAILILGISSIMMVFNQKDLKNRNKISPMKLRSQNLQLLTGSLCFSLVLWALLSIIGYFFFRITDCSVITFLLYTFNLLLMTLTALSISFFVGIFIKGKNAQSGIANVLSLGLCFISGVFVPQIFLGDGVLSIAQFSPVYWFVKVNNRIGELVLFSRENLMPLFMEMFILLIFSIAILSVALVLTKVLREKE